MRVAAALTLTVFILGGMWAYTSFTNSLRIERSEVAEAEAAGQFQLEVVSTFDAAGDEFGQSALLIKFRDRVLLDLKELKAGEKAIITDLPEIKEGRNDFFVVLSPRETSQKSGSDPFSLESSGSTNTPDTVDQTSIARAVNIRITRDGLIVAQETLWSSAPGPISDLVELEVTTTESDNHNH